MDIYQFFRCSLGFITIQMRANSEVIVALGHYRVDKIYLLKDASSSLIVTLYLQSINQSINQVQFLFFSSSKFLREFRTI